jgi:hypothetical protein
VSKPKQSKFKKRLERPPAGPVEVGLTLLPETLESLDAEREGLPRHKAARRIVTGIYLPRVASVLLLPYSHSFHNEI